MKEFRCKDAGHTCDWSVRSNDEREIIDKAKEHGRDFHQMQQVKDEQIRPLIHDVA